MTSQLNNGIDQPDGAAAMGDAAHKGGAKISVIIPTMNEAENIPLLVPRLNKALAGRDHEIVIVDDNSRDNTESVCRELAEKYPLRLIVRREPKNGLSGAVLEGIAQSDGDVIVVMDADLQHPPESVPALVAVLEEGRGDFALGSRYVAGGSMDGDWGLFRQINSQVATLLARPFAGPVLDPMSGFFALKRKTYAGAKRLTPLGYKIALELICKCRVKQVVEVPIHFGLRQKGESKLSLKQQFRYMEHLSRLYDFTFPRLSPMGKFLIVTGVSWLAALGVFMGMRRWDAGFIAAPAVGWLAAILATAIFHIRYIRTQREFLVARHPWLDFVLASSAEMAVCLLAGAWLQSRAPNVVPLEEFALCCLAATLTRYVLRKELFQDIRGLRRDPRSMEL